MFGWSLDTRGMNNSLYPQHVEGWQGNCTEPVVQQHDVQIVQLQRKKIWSKRRVLDTDDVKQKTSLFPVQGKICLVYCFMVLFFCFTSSVAVQEVNSENIIYLSLQPCKNYEGDSCTGILMKVGKTYFRVQSTFLPHNCFHALASNFQQDFRLSLWDLN